MNIIDDSIVEFFDNNIHLLDEDKFDEFVDVLEDSIHITKRSIIYKMLRKAGIDILPNISHVPTAYFYLDNEIESVILPPNIKCIDTDAFFNCDNIKSITIPESVENIGSICLLNSLSKLSLPSNLKTLGFIFGLHSIKELTLPKYVQLTCKDVSAISSCTNLETFRFNYHDNLMINRSIRGLLQACPNLKTIEYLEGTTAALKFWGTGCANNRKKDLYLARSVEYIDAELTYRDKLYTFHVYKDSKADKLLKQEHPECKIVYRD